MVENYTLSTLEIPIEHKKRKFMEDEFSVSNLKIDKIVSAQEMNQELSEIPISNLPGKDH